MNHYSETMTAEMTLIPPRVGGWSLIGAAALFWPVWFLMPEPGTVDAAFILRAIAEQRGAVLISAILQTICAVAIVPAVLSVASSRSRLVRVGAVLMLVGALGNAADAVYHQLAYEMTAPDVNRTAMFPVMTRMQTEQILLLAPLLIAFFPGAACFCIGLSREGRAPRKVGRLFAIALAVALAGALAALTLDISPRILTLKALAVFSVAIGWTGWEMRRPGAPAIR
jgi:hypothetical protein